MFQPVSSIGKYFLFLYEAFKKPQNLKVYYKLIMREINDLGINSLGLVLFTSLFVGAVVAIQMYNNFDGAAIPIPVYYVGFATKTVLVLEFCPTIISVILGGKVGSFIASSIGTMKVTEQIDALDVMGINSISFLVLPKIIAALVFFPILIMISMVLGIYGGYLAGIITNKWSAIDYIQGLQMPFRDFYFVYAFIKVLFFAFIIATIPAYYGYNVKGGSLEVGRSSTQAVVWTIVMIIIMNLILTHIMLG